MCTFCLPLFSFIFIFNFNFNFILDLTNCHKRKGLSCHWELFLEMSLDVYPIKKKRREEKKEKREKRVEERRREEKKNDLILYKIYAGCSGVLLFSPSSLCMKQRTFLWRSWKRDL